MASTANDVPAYLPRRDLDDIQLFFEMNWDHQPEVKTMSDYILGKFSKKRQLDAFQHNANVMSEAVSKYGKPTKDYTPPWFIQFVNTRNK